MQTSFRLQILKNNQICRNRPDIGKKKHKKHIRKREGKSRLEGLINTQSGVKAEHGEDHLTALRGGDPVRRMSQREPPEEDKAEDHKDDIVYCDSLKFLARSENKKK